MPDALTTADPAPAVSAEARRPTPEMIAAAWRAFRGDRPGPLPGPGPGFVEAIAAAMALDPRVAEMEAEVRRLREAAEDIAWQFAHTGTRDGRLVLSTGGLSALETAFDALGWPDPKPCPERECEASDCHKEATTGTPTASGYKRLCFDHYREMSVTSDAARRGHPTEGENTDAR